MGRKRYDYRKRIVAKFELDELEFLLDKKGNKTWSDFILELAGYKKKKENEVEAGGSGGQEETNYGPSK